MSTETTERNVERVERIEDILALLYDDAPIRDVLVDLRHYCDAKGINFGDEDRIAYSHYIEEICP